MLPALVAVGKEFVGVLIGRERNKASQRGRLQARMQASGSRAGERQRLPAPLGGYGNRPACMTKTRLGIWPHGSDRS